MSPSLLTIVILTFNEEDNVLECLDSVAGIGARVFAVDSYSTDRTVELLAARGIATVQHPFVNYAEQRNWAQANIPWETSWVFHLDAGERCLPRLATWIREEFPRASEGYAGVMVARRAIFMGRWIRRGGYHPIYHLRLYRLGAGHCEDKVYDQHFVVEGEVLRAPEGADLSDSVMTNLRDFTVAHARWAAYEAIESIAAAQNTGEVSSKLFGTPIERRRWFKQEVFGRVPVLVRSILYFFHRYFILLGFLDGRRGLIFHVLQGFWFRFLVDSMIVEMRRALPGSTLQAVAMETYGIDADELLRSTPAS